ncbi:hypothetical protein DL98DRAFT_527110 [Cadophora sp. DSE1049]|nr:hypothetical protein DL98DRAFT_527110 [Cadophora sp. DSE1049]
MSNQPQTFHKFNSLPPEIRLRIWALSLPPPRNTSNIIHIHFTQTAYLPLPKKLKNKHKHQSKQKLHTPKLSYAFKLFSPTCPHGPPPPDLRSRESYTSYLLQNPHELRLNRGQRIRFNAVRDTIFMDLNSLYALGQYLTYRDQSTIHRNLRGFNDIQTLGTPLRYCDREGFVSRRDYGLTRHALGGVVRFVRVAEMPGVVDEEGMARMEVVRGLKGELRALLASRKWSREIANEIWVVEEGIEGDVDKFFGPPDSEGRFGELEEEEGLDEARVLDRNGDDREQCMDPECGFCRMGSWEEKKFSMAGRG